MGEEAGAQGRTMGAEGPSPPHNSQTSQLQTAVLIPGPWGDPIRPGSTQTFHPPRLLSCCLLWLAMAISWNIKIHHLYMCLSFASRGNKGTIGSDLVLDGRHEFDQIQGVLPVPAPVKQLLAGPPILQLHSFRFFDAQPKYLPNSVSWN